MLSSAHDKRTDPPPIATIGVGYNGSSRSARALAVGRELAAARGARLRVMEVVCPARAVFAPRAAVELGTCVDTLLQQARERLAELSGVEACAVYGIAVDELAAFAEEVDLLVLGMGSHRAGRGSLILASTSDYLKRHASCPVLVVPCTRLSCAEHRVPGAACSSRSLRRARWCAR